MGSCGSSIKKENVLEKKRGELAEVREKRKSSKNEKQHNDDSNQVNGQKIADSVNVVDSVNTENVNVVNSINTENVNVVDSINTENVNVVDSINTENVNNNDNNVKPITEEENKKQKIIILNGAPGSGKDTQSNLILTKYNFQLIIVSELLKNYVNKYKKKKSKEIENENKNENENENEKKEDNQINEKTNGEVELTVEEKNLRIIQKCFIDGSLVPNNTVISIFIEELNNVMKNNKTNVKGVLINGFPRTEEQALLFKQKNIHVDALINITVSKENLWNRIKNRLVDPVTNLTYNTDIIEIIKKQKRGEELTEEENIIISENANLKLLEDEVLNRLKKRDDDDQEVFNKRYDLYKENEEKIIEVFQDVHKSVNGEMSKEQVFQEIAQIIDNL